VKNLVMFFGSCGHVDIKQVSDEEWQSFVNQHPAGPLGNAYAKNRFKVGVRTRTVYVYPTRYCICQACVLEVLQESPWESQDANQA
jgi:hypothetical protein